MKQLLLFLLMTPLIGLSQPTFDFTNSDDGWNLLWRFTGTTFPDYYKLTTVPGNGTLNNPNFRNSATGVNSADVSWIAITLRNNDLNGPMRLSVRYPNLTGSGPANVVRNTNITTGDTEFATYWLDLSGAYWVGTIDDLTITFSNDDGPYILPDDPISIDIDKIEFLDQPTTTLQNSYLFNTYGITEGFFQFSGAITEVADGRLVFKPNANQFARIQQELHYVDATNNKFLHFTIKNNSALNDQIRLISTDGLWTSKLFAVTVSDDDFKTYTFDLTAEPAWTGEQMFRIGVGAFDNGNKAADDGTVEFKSIIFNNNDGSVKTWTGLASNDWFDGDNWDGGSSPSPSTDVVIPVVLDANPQVLNPAPSEFAVCNNLTVENGGLLVLGPDGSLTVGGTLNNEGFVGVISDADFNGSLICSDLQGTGSYQYWRYLGITGDPAAPTTGWHYISSPTQGFGSHAMFDYYINTWDEPTGLWIQHISEDPNQPCVPAPEITNDGMEGWSVKWDPDYSSYGCPAPGTGDVVEFIGTYNTGDQSATLTYSGVGDYDGFNMVGNPYPSYWDYDLFVGGPNWPATGLNDAIYYWDESAAQYASYVDGIGNLGGSNLVPPTQAFFLELDGDEATVDLTFTQDEQAHGAVPFYKEDPSNLLRLEVAANGYSDQTTIRFNENATTSRDKVDARKLFSSGAVPGLYTIGGDVELSINQMPDSDIVPLYFKCGVSGTYSIKAVETSEFSIVILEDKLTGEETNLLTDSYSFNYVEGEAPDRFNVHFKSTGVSTNLTDQVNIWSGERKIYVRADPSARGEIVVFNMMGQEVARKAIKQGLNSISMDEVNANYVVKVMTTNNVFTGKVFIR